jgi:hypothetical protein
VLAGCPEAAIVEEMPVLGPKTPRYPLGISDYRELRRNGYSYVDKTAFAADVLAGDAKVLLFPRPRRFGKTLNIRMLQAFLERGGDDTTDIFADTTVWSWNEGQAREHFKRYPVIALSFKDVKGKTWTQLWTDLQLLLTNELTRLPENGTLDEGKCPSPDYVAKLRHPDAGPDAFRHYLSVLSEWAYATTREPVVIPIDEYDAPLHAAWQHSHWDDTVGFFRTFLSSGFKDNARLFRGVLTGILKVAKENIFSGLNNLSTLSILQSHCAQHFGFTQAEVDELLKAANLFEQRDQVRDWYDGYRFGMSDPVVLYNPWSLLCWLNAPEDGFQSFWKNSSSNDLVRELLIKQAAEIGPELQALVRGETVERLLDENVAFQDLERSKSALWSILTFTGYLTPVHSAHVQRHSQAALRIPNQEVLSIFEDTFLPLVTDQPTSLSRSTLAEAMLSGDASRFARLLTDSLTAALSYHVVAQLPTGRPVEAVYQAFIVGLLLHLQDTHRVVSNREAGAGRADVLVIPKSPGPGVVLELKTIDKRFGETAESSMQRALEQLRKRDYAAELRAAGATEVHELAVVFDSKVCDVRKP